MKEQAERMADEFERAFSAVRKLAEAPSAPRFVGWKDAAGNVPYLEDRRAKVPVAAKQTQLQAQRKRERQNRKRARSR